MASPSTLLSSRNHRWTLRTPWLHIPSSSSVLPISHPLPRLPPRTAPNITVTSPGFLTPQNLPSFPVCSTGPLTASVATASCACTTPNSNMSLTSSTSISSCTISPSIAPTRKTTPISVSEVRRYNRARIIPPVNGRVIIEPGNKSFNDNSPSSRWEPLTHPEGALYYYDSTNRIYTDADLSLLSTLTAIEEISDRMYHSARANPNIDITSKTELVIEDVDENTYGYYFVEPDTRCIFWLDRFDATPILKHVRRVQNMGHIKYAIEAEYWTHCELFPRENRITPVILEELKQMIIHAAAVTLTSVTSVSPFEKEELEKMLDLVNNIEGTVDGSFAHTRCVVARFMSEFARAKFFNFCGQPGARLDSDQTIYPDREHRSILFIIASILLFGAPGTHQQDLKVIWVDRIINRVLWKQFIGKLSDQWAGLALSATVILNANVAFLAIQSVQTMAKLLSYLSVVSSIGVVILVLLLVRQTRDGGSAEQAVSLLTEVSRSFLGTETLAITYGLPYGLLMWSLISFAAAFATLIFGTEGTGTRGAVGCSGLLVVGFVVLVMRMGGHRTYPREDKSV